MSDLSAHVVPKADYDALQKEVDRLQAHGQRLEERLHRVYEDAREFRRQADELNADRSYTHAQKYGAWQLLLNQFGARLFNQTFEVEAYSPRDSEIPF